MMRGKFFFVNLSHGPIMVVEYFSGDKVNDYRFHTKVRNESKATYNYGMCVKGVGAGDEVCNNNPLILHHLRQLL